MKKTFLFLFYLLAGIITGALLANVCNGLGIPLIGYSNTIVLNPTVLDLIIVKITFGFTMTVSVAQIITIAIAMFLYERNN